MAVLPEVESLSQSFTVFSSTWTRACTVYKPSWKVHSIFDFPHYKFSFLVELKEFKVMDYGFLNSHFMQRVTSKWMKTSCKVWNLKVHRVLSYWVSFINHLNSMALKTPRFRSLAPRVYNTEKWNPGKKRKTSHDKWIYLTLKKPFNLIIANNGIHLYVY